MSAGNIAILRTIQSAKYFLCLSSGKYFTHRRYMNKLCFLHKKTEQRKLCSHMENHYNFDTMHTP